MVSGLGLKAFKRREETEGEEREILGIIREY
jgi:hypothetical protein